MIDHFTNYHKLYHRSPRYLMYLKEMIGGDDMSAISDRSDDALLKHNFHIDSFNACSESIFFHYSLKYLFIVDTL